MTALRKLLLLPALLLCLCAAAEGDALSGTCGADVTWTLDDGGTLTISGSGPMKSYSESEGSPWYAYRDQILRAVVGEGVTSVGSYAFEYCRSMTEISLPDGLTAIGKAAFEKCDSLKRIGIPESVATISGYAFYACAALEQANIPDGVTVIRNRTFYGCESLKRIALPDSVTSVEEHAFDSCKSMQRLDLGAGVGVIGKYAFYDCRSLPEVRVPDSVYRIEGYAFDGCDAVLRFVFEGMDAPYLESYAMGDVRTVVCHADSEAAAWAAEKGYTVLSAGSTALRLPDSAKVVGEEAFTGIAASSAVVPEEVASVGARAFAGNAGLMYAQIDGAQTNIADDAFEDSDHVILTGPPDGAAAQLAQKTGLAWMPE